jgi:hypothetical protein
MMHLIPRIAAAFFIVLLAGPAGSVAAQPDSSDVRGEVLAVVQQLFDGMRAGDSTAVRGVFTDAARMQSVQQGEEGLVLRDGSVDRFVEAVGRPRDAVWDERIWDPIVRVDGPMAMAWTPYAFYRGDALSHCGVNAFHLIRRGGGWSVFYLVDTRRQDCEIPAEVRKGTGEGENG